MPAQTTECVHCSAPNPIGGAFCESCGKALPSAVPTVPRVLSGDAMPTTSAAAKLLGDELGKQTKSAATTLLVVGIIQIVVGGVLTAVLMSARPGRTAAQLNLPVVVASTAGIGVIFIGLYFWARRSPLPATIVGLVIYGTLVLLNMVSAASARAQNGAASSGFGGLGVGCLDIIII